MPSVHTAANQARHSRSKKASSHSRIENRPLIDHSPWYTDALIPLLIRGPGITPNTTNSADIYSMPDLGATILDLAGATANYTLDGRPISFESTGIRNDTYVATNVNDTDTVEEPRHTITEYWNIGSFEGIYAG